MTTVALRHFGNRIQTRDAESRFYTPRQVAEVNETAERGRQAAAKVKAELDHNATVGRGYREFWNKKSAELRDSIRL
jgi:hypothetical protein